MAPRAMSTGTISFGLVSIPVKVYSATQASETISFNLLHKDCGSRLKQQYICQKDGGIVEREEMVKGYEFSRGQYVVFSEEELRTLEETPTQAIEITEFLPVTSVDPIYFDKPYFLGPDKGGDRAYALLGAAMRESGLCALAKYASRGKQYLVMLRPIDGGMVMQQLHYADEVRTFNEIGVPSVELKEAELKMALQLAEMSRSESFHPEEYRDEVKDRTEKLIAKKIEGEEITSSAPVEEKGAKVIDLMEALRASLGEKPRKAAKAERGKVASNLEVVSDRKPARRVAAVSGKTPKAKVKGRSAK